VKDALDLRICKLERNLEDVCLHSTTPHKNPVHQAVQYDALLEAANTSFGLLSMREGSEESVVVRIKHFFSFFGSSSASFFIRW